MFGEKIKKTMSIKKISRIELSKRTGISYTSLRYMLNNDDFKKEALKKIGDALDIEFIAKDKNEKLYTTDAFREILDEIIEEVELKKNTIGK